MNGRVFLGTLGCNLQLTALAAAAALQVVALPYAMPSLEAWIRSKQGRLEEEGAYLKQRAWGIASIRDHVMKVDFLFNYHVIKISF